MFLVRKLGAPVIHPIALALMATAVLAMPAHAGAAGTAGKAGSTPQVAGDTGTIQVMPNALSLVIRQGQRSEHTLTLTNSGTTETAWQIADGPGGRQPSLPAAGTVITSWPANGVSVGLGIGIESGRVWISDVDIFRNDSFTVRGVLRAEGWPTTWANEWPGPADMAYLPGRGLMCQVIGGLDNGIHCWNPRTGDVLADVVGELPWTSLPQRGLAYRPDDDTFYVGGRDQGIIYHIRGLGSADPGSVISQCTPDDPAITGLGWSQGFGLLWVATDGPDRLIYAVDPDTCRTLATLAAPDRARFRGGGLDVDPAGNLWILSAGSPGTAYLVGSGVPTFSDVSWLSATPRAGSLAGRGQSRLTVRVDATRLARGRHRATLYLLSSDGAQPALVRVPVSLVVR